MNQRQLANYQPFSINQRINQLDLLNPLLLYRLLSGATANGPLVANRPSSMAPVTMTRETKPPRHTSPPEKKTVLRTPEEHREEKKQKKKSKHTKTKKNFKSFKKMQCKEVKGSRFQCFYLSNMLSSKCF